MYKLLIVDDFELDRTKIKKIINSWSEQIVNIVGECENGEEALRFLERIQVDIVISDIEMPYMNGLKMAKSINEKFGSSIKIIFCTLYNEFKYAQEAIYANSFGYILKPVQSDELLGCIRRVTGEILKEITLKNDYNDLQNTLESFKPVIINNFLRDILYGINTCETDIWEKARYFGLSLCRGCFGIIYIEIDDYEIITVGQSIDEKQLFSIRVYESIKKITDQIKYFHITRIDEMHFVVIASESEQGYLNKRIYNCSERISDMAEAMGISLSISISDACTKAEDIKNLYEQSKFIMRYKFSMGKGKIFSSDDIPEKTVFDNIDTTSLQKDIRYLVSSGNRTEIEQYIDENIKNMSGKANYNSLRNYCFSIVLCIRFTLSENNVNLSEVFTDENLIWDKLQKFETILDAANWIKNMLYFANEHLAKKSSSKNTAIVDEIKKYVLNNIDKSVGLDDLAVELHYSPNYLNYVFKLAYGETISDFITDSKIEKAKEMLGDVRNKVQYISDSLGFSHAAYFCSVFKKKTGITAKEYRERVIR